MVRGEKPFLLVYYSGHAGLGGLELGPDLGQLGDGTTAETGAGSSRRLVR